MAVYLKSIFYKRMIVKPEVAEICNFYYPHFVNKQENTTYLRVSILGNYFYKCMISLKIILINSNNKLLIMNIQQ